ncbi:acyl carrier protein [Paenibacillus mesotrionivorans]|jgi:acyl carrier protein|uniref:Acyl carrier protein n=1 Tax=Paenibacillus mesotrionivorans TaxID=3160968 RepID=A0ACC7NWN3_9BACL
MANIEQVVEVIESRAIGAKGLQVGASTSLRNELGLDSLRLVDIMISLEERFDITFDESDLNPSGLQNVGDLLLLINKSLEGA